MSAPPWRTGLGDACWWLEPLEARLVAEVFGSSNLLADETPVPVLDPGRGRTRAGRLWVYARDDRPWDGQEAPTAVYIYSPDRKAERPAAQASAVRCQREFRCILKAAIIAAIP